MELAKKIVTNPFAQVVFGIALILGGTALMGFLGGQPAGWAMALGGIGALLGVMSFVCGSTGFLPQNRKRMDLFASSPNT